MNGMENMLIDGKIINADVKRTICEVLQIESTSIQKRYWPYERIKKEVQRSNNFFEVTVPQYRLDQFKEHFRMSRETFASLLKVVACEAPKHNEPITHVPMEKKLLFTIWIVSKQESFLAVGDRFGLAKSSGHIIFSFCIKILSKLMPRFVKWPNRALQAKSAEVFQEKYPGIPGVIGVIDVCHIPIKQPVANSTDFFNRKEFHSIILQGVCDSKCQFIDVFIGQPGSMHDARVFQTSPLHTKIFNENDPLIDNELHLIGDHAYPLCVNILTPYSDNSYLLPDQVRYNKTHSEIYSVIERTFGLLKGKFQRLKYLNVQLPKLANNIISACCMMHNFIIAKENVDDSIIYEPDDLELDASVEITATTNEKAISTEASKKRNNIKNLLKSKRMHFIQ